MRKISIFIFSILLIICLCPKVYAASASISASKTTVTVGDSVSINVHVYGGAWNLSVSGNGINGDSIVGYDMDGNVNTNKSYSLNTSSAGTYTISLVGDVTDYDTDVNTKINTSVTVTVNEAPAVVEPAPSNNTNSNTNTNTSNNSNVSSNTSANNSASNTNTSKNNNTTNNSTNNTVTEPIVPIEESNNDVVELSPEEEVASDIQLSRFEIVGYPIDFKSDIYDYTIELMNDVNKLYLIVEGNDIEVSGDKEVDVTDKEFIVVNVKQGDVTKEYTILLKRVNKEGLLSNVDDKEKSKSGIVYIIFTVIFGISTILLSILLINNKRKKSIINNDVKPINPVSSLTEAVIKNESNNFVSENNLSKASEVKNVNGSNVLPKIDLPQIKK